MKILIVSTTWILLNLLCPSLCIRLVGLSVPPYEVVGDVVTLGCDFDLEEDVLYSVTWYRNNEQFYRFVPSAEPRIKTFNVTGIRINVAESGAKTVQLQSVSLQTSGSFKCEATADYPTFSTVSAMSNMLVVDLPDEAPTISGSKMRYHIGDEVSANCSSHRSRPAASLMWYINGEPVEPAILHQYAPVLGEDGLETSVLGLQFTVSSRHFPNGELRLKCTATIAAVYWQSSEEAVEGSQPQTQPALESKAVYLGTDERPALSSSGNSITQNKYSYFFLTISFLLFHLI